MKAVRGVWPWALAGLVLLALALRALGFEWVFVGGGEVVLRVGDGQYHARRALVTFLHFPKLLLFDPYINYPRGASIQLPPLYDFLTASLARLLGRDLGVFEAVLAWWGPISGSLAALPVYAAARRVADRSTAWGAAFIFALLPILVTSSGVGDADKTAFVGLLGAGLLAVALRLVSPGVRGRSLVIGGVELALLGAVLPMCWSGSLLYTGIAYGLIVLVATLDARRDSLTVVAVALAVSGAVLLPVVLVSPEPVGGAYSAIALSMLHVRLALSAAALAAAAAWLERWRPERSAAGRAFGLGVSAALVGIAQLADPALRDGFLRGLDFVGTAAPQATAVQELLPLFSLPGRPAAQPADLYFGLFAYAVPLAPAAALWVARGREVRAPALLLAGWSGVLALMTLWQARYGADFSAAGAVCFALLLASGVRAGIRRVGLPGAAALPLLAVLVLALLWKPIWTRYAPPARASLSALFDGLPTGDRALATPSGSVKRFMQEVRRVTPETAGYADPTQRPEYGILTSPNLGHALNYVARRAAPANGLQDLMDPEVYGLSQEFFQAPSERRGLAIARALRCRYAITLDFPGSRPGSLGSRLQYGDGLADQRVPRLARIRLVTEGPAGGRPLGAMLGLPGDGRVAPYKLFEIVAGARLEIAAPPGSAVEAELRLRTPTGREFRYKARGRADASGIARLRVPYATEAVLPVFATGAYRVRAGERVHRLEVPESAVQRGAVVAVGG